MSSAESLRHERAQHEDAGHGMSSPARGAQTPMEHGTVQPGGTLPHRRRWVTPSLVLLIIVAVVAAGTGIAALLTHGFASQTTVR